LIVKLLLDKVLRQQSNNLYHQTILNDFLNYELDYNLHTELFTQL